jgi:hypothetical protein
MNRNPSGNLYRSAVALLVLVAAVLFLGVSAGGARADGSPFTAVALPTLASPLDYAAQAQKLNDAGQVVGLAMNHPTPPAIFEAHVFSWTSAGGMVDISTGSGYDTNTVRAVNSGGQSMTAAKSSGPPTVKPSCGRRRAAWSASARCPVPTTLNRST